MKQGDLFKTKFVRGESGLLVMAPAIVAAFFWSRATAAGALVSMIIGAAATAAMYLSGFYRLGWWPSVWGGGLTLLLFITLSLMTTPPENAKQFIEAVEKELVAYRFRAASRETTNRHSL